MAYSLLLSTTSSKDEAQSIAQTLVERKLVACVNIVGPITSVYRWKGAIEDSQEFLLLMKTDSQKFNEVRDALKALHSYEVPELVELSIENGIPSYLNWIAESLR